MHDLSGFVLSRQWREEGDGLAYTLWLATERGPVRVHVTRQEAVVFVHRTVETQAGRREPLEMTAVDGRPVDAVYFRSLRALRDEADRLRRALVCPLESDVKPLDRYLMERFVTGSVRVRGPLIERAGYLEMPDPQLKADDSYEPSLQVRSLDIETDGPDGPVLSIGWVGGGEEIAFVRGEGPEAPNVRYVPNERSLLRAFVARVTEDDPDVIVGWNVVEFDLAWLERRAEACGVPFSIGRGGERGTVLPPRREGQPHVARVPGRVVLDGIGTMRSATWSFESWRLGDVAEALLGRGKHIDHHVDPIAEIRRMWNEDKPALARYNLEDCRLALEIAERADLVGFAVARQRMTGLPMDRQGGSVAAFDHLYLPRLHRHGHVAPDVGDSGEALTSPGGYVLESRPGLYENVLVLDFKSLYPSIIRTFRIDPMGLAFPGDDPVTGFDGARFHRSRHILPGLIESLWNERDRAKRAENAALSQAIKILMNSFYGVLGTPGCRFFDPRLASSITRRGHQIITQTRDAIEARGLPVIYGDTDSLFVLLGPSRNEEECRRVGGELARDLNAWWADRLSEEHRLESFLELEFETHYLRFLMPTLRGSDRGTKKRYAGSVRWPGGGMRVVIKGLEAARTDWTPLARRFQRELFRRVFSGEAYEDFVRDVSAEVRAGKLDEELVYRKRLRRRIEEYGDHAPPHVQAARKLGVAVREVRYCVTRAGPEPVGMLTSPLDYDHYLERQLAPAADVVLSFLGTDFARLAGRQMSLF